MDRHPLSLLAFCSLIISPAWAAAAEITVTPDDGVAFKQLDFPEDSEPLLNSNVGLFELNLIQLRLNTGMQAGFINISSDGEWLVKNLPVQSVSAYPYSHLSSRFDLGVPSGTDVSSLEASIIYSDELLSSAPSATPNQYAVNSESVVQGGLTESTLGSQSGTSPREVPMLSSVSHPDPTNNRTSFQWDHPNIEAAQNQCLPASVANSLQFLENTTDLVVPHPNTMGLRGDSTLVGQLDSWMQRNVSSRRAGSATSIYNGIIGKLQYLASNDLHDRVSTRHWGVLGDTDYDVHLNNNTVSSDGQGKNLNIDSLIDALDGGEDCEAGYFYPDGRGGWGGHAVDLVAAGYIAGKPFMIESSDLNQTSDAHGAGRSGFLFSWLSQEPNQDGFLVMNGSQQVLGFAMCQKYEPEQQPTGTSLPPPGNDYFIPGANVEIVSVGDPAGHRPFVESPEDFFNFWIRSSLSIIQMFVAGWMPEVTYNPETGSLSGEKTSTVAGYSNIKTRVTGRINSDSIEVTASIGDDGGLPQGQPLVYELKITPEEPWPWAFTDADPVLQPAVRINGFRNNVFIPAGEPVAINVSLEPGSNPTESDWWLVAEVDNAFYSYDPGVNNWVPGLVPAVTTTPSALMPSTIFTFESGLPAGEYDIHFGIDGVPNQMMDFEDLTFDTVTLTVTSP